MEKILKLIATRLGFIKIIINKATTYLDLVKDIVRAHMPDEYNRILSTFESLDHLLKDFANIKLVDITLECIMNIYQKLITIDDLCAQLVLLLENQYYMKMAIYNMSTTYSINIHNDKNSALDSYEKYHAMSIGDDEEIFGIVFGHVTNVDEILNFIIAHEATINKFMIRLISHIIDSVRPTLRRRLELIIEKQKDLLLGATRIDLSQYVGAQNCVVRYFLRPVTGSLPISDIFAKLGIKYNIKKTVNENCRIAACNGMGIILLSKSNASPVEFSLDGLINDKYIIEHNLKTNPILGLNKKIIERFTTARTLPRGAGVGAAAPGHNVKYPGKVNKWIVIETINGEHWRILGRAGLFELTTDVITGLVEGLSLRAHQYHMIQSEDIINKCLDPKSNLILSDYEKLKVSLPSSEPIKAAILDEMFKTFKCDDVKNMSQFRNAIINRTVISEILLNELMSRSEKHSIEYNITFIAKIDIIANSFIKELERKCSNNIIPPRVFKEHTGAALCEILTNIFNNIVRAAIDELDKLNTWTDYDIPLKEFFIDKKQIII